MPQSSSTLSTPTLATVPDSSGLESCAIAAIADQVAEGVQQLAETPQAQETLLENIQDKLTQVQSSLK